jgi:hypothetical protein
MEDELLASLIMVLPLYFSCSDLAVITSLALADSGLTSLLVLVTCSNCVLAVAKSSLRSIISASLAVICFIFSASSSFRSTISVDSSFLRDFFLVFDNSVSLSAIATFTSSRFDLIV